MFTCEIPRQLYKQVVIGVFLGGLVVSPILVVVVDRSRPDRRADAGGLGHVGSSFGGEKHLVDRIPRFCLLCLRSGPIHTRKHEALRRAGGQKMQNPVNQAQVLTELWFAPQILAKTTVLPVNLRATRRKAGRALGKCVPRRSLGTRRLASEDSQQTHAHASAQAWAWHPTLPS